MKVLGIVAEYNPFHNGHKYQIEQAKKITGADFVICVMSGNFVEQGNISILDKYTRANIAIKNGIDLVIELPSVFAVSSSEFFSYSAVKLLNDLNIVDYISFGTECDNIKTLLNIADNILLNEDNIWDRIKHELKNGISFPIARENALKYFLSKEELLEISKSNNILGIEYIKSLKKLKSNIQPITIKREGMEYNEKSIVDLNISPKYISATSIRHMICNNDTNILNSNGYSKYIFSNLKEYVPEQTIKALKTNPHKSNTDLFDLLKYKIISMDVESLKNIHEITEGLENKFKSEIISSFTYEEYISKVKSKRYTESKIRRCTINILLNITKDFFEKTLHIPHYAHILSLNLEKKDILSILSKSSNIPFLVNYSDKNIEKNNLNDLQKLLVETDILATNIYSILTKSFLNKDLTNKI